MKAVSDTFEIDLSTTILTPAHIRVTRHKTGEFTPERDPHVMYLDAEALEGDARFCLRHWRKGDSIRPFGMEGRRKVSDIFTDAHLSRPAKDRVWILTRGEELLWVVGLRSSALFAVTPSTREYLRLQWLP